MEKTQENKLDLHGVRHTEVERLVENFVLLNNPPLEIITGNSNKMEDIVLTTLKELEINWEKWYNGSIKILKIK
tara:strand:+ start:618 stop:839 length:222 start_codon:yes stop_codon:yes gene_type:complete